MGEGGGVATDGAAGGPCQKDRVGRGRCETWASLCGRRERRVHELRAGGHVAFLPSLSGGVERTAGECEKGAGRIS